MVESHRSWAGAASAQRRRGSPTSRRAVPPATSPATAASPAASSDRAVDRAAGAILTAVVAVVVGAGAALATIEQPPPAPAPAVGTLPAVTAVPVASEFDAEAPPPRRLTIERLGVDQDLIGLRTGPDGALEIPQDPDDVGWHRAGTAPGDAGPAVLVGHVDSYEGAAVFFRLRELVPGDRVAVTRVDGSVVAFEVYGLETVEKNAFPTDRVYGATEGAELRLITCGGTFDETSRSYTQNVVVYARQVAPPAGSPS